MPKVKNKLYSEFLKEKKFNTINKEKFKDILETINYKDPKFVDRARAFMIILFYSQHRPSEILNLRWQDINIYDDHIEFKFCTRKGKKESLAFINKDDITCELWDFYKKRVTFDLMYVFYELRSKNTKQITQKNGNVCEYDINSNNIYYWIKKWTSIVEIDVSPYYFRHNATMRFIMAGGSTSEATQARGAADERSVSKYVCHSEDTAKKIATIMQNAP